AGRHGGAAGGPDEHRRRDSRPRLLAPGRQLLRVRLHVERARADPPGAARGRARLLRDARRAGPGRDGRHEHSRHGGLGLDLRSLRAQGAPRLLLRGARPVPALPPVRLERAVAAHFRGNLRAELHLDGAAHHHADRQYLRPLLGGCALGLDLLRPPGGRGARRGGGGLDLQRHRLLRLGLRLGRPDGVPGRPHGAGHQGSAGEPHPARDPGAGGPARPGGLAGWSRIMGMANEGTTQLPPDFVRDFPFESRLSLASLIRFWDEQAKDPSVCGEMARSLMTRVHQVPALLGPIEDITLLDEHGELVDGLMGAVFPPVFWEQAYMGALVPFTLRSVYGTRAFDNQIMGPDGVLYGRLNLEMHALKDFRLLNAYALILERLYDIKFPVDYPLILTMPEPETGLDRHFKIQFEGRFVDVEALRPLPPLSDEMRARLTAQGVDLEGLKALIPPGSVRFSGFTVVKALDVTDQEVLSSIKRDLIDKESIVSNARFVKLQEKLRTLFRRAELRLSLAAIEGERILMLNSGHQLDHGQGCIF